MSSTVAERWRSFSTVRYVTIIAFDAMATVCGLYAAMLLRLIGEVPSSFAAEARSALPLLLLIRICTIMAARLHRWSFQMSGLSEGVRLVFAMLAASVVFAIGFEQLPRSVYALEFFITTSLMAGYRYAPRFL